MIEVKGNGNNIARLIKHSVTRQGVHLYTWELEYWRAIHAEMMTHRMISKNAASTRAVPVERAIELALENTGTPIHWGANNPGMQSRAELQGVQLEAAKGAWRAALEQATSAARVMSAKVGINGHKQWAGRVLEPFSVMKIVATCTEYENLELLRDHVDAQPEFRDLVQCMKAARLQSVPEQLAPGEWHLPYIDAARDADGVLRYYAEGKEIDLDTARKISTSCCAQVSYRRADASADKALEIFDKLNLFSTENPPHFSPAEHQATAQDLDAQVLQDLNLDCNAWEPGITHVTRNGSRWSGNLRGWVQYRQLIAQGVYTS